MIQRLDVPCAVWPGMPNHWLVKFDYNNVKECIELSFIFTDTEEMIEADMDRRFPL